MKKFDLEERLIDFGVLCIKIAKNLPGDIPGNNLADQLVRSGTSPSLNYGEAQSAESRKDFIHKIKIILKELRETRICLKLINRTFSGHDDSRINLALSECNELISIFVRSVQTARSNLNRDKQINEQT